MKVENILNHVVSHSLNHVFMIILMTNEALKLVWSK
jgi:hypothetical protein